MKHNEIQLGGMSVPALVARDREALVETVLVELVTQLPAYARLPRELIDTDVRRVASDALRLFANSLSSGLDDARLASLVDSAVLQADERVAIETVIAAYYCGARVAVDHCLAAATPSDHDDVRRFTGATLTFMESVTSAVAGGFARFSDTTLTERADARQLLLTALLSGEGYREAAARAEIVLPQTYLVVSLAVGPHPDESDPHVDRVVANRRKLRRLRQVLDQRHASDVLWQPATNGGLTLLPDNDLTRLATTITEAQWAAGASIHAGATVASPDEIPAAARLSREVIEVALATDRPAGLYQLGDVALDYQLRQPSAAQPVLAALLAPLAVHPDLEDTLRIFQETGSNRRRTAARLHVHTNTVDNRLRRIFELTGLDPTDPADIPAIRAALAATA